MGELRVHTMAWVDGARRLWLRLQGVQTRTIQTAQGKVRFLEVEGTGTLPPILLVHGLSSAAVDWGTTIRKLRTHHTRVRAIDLPGHGLSDTPQDGMSAEAMRQMLTEASSVYMDEPQIIMGNSLGGLAAVRMAGRKPDQTLALVLVSPGGTPIPAAELDALLDRFEIDSWAKAHSFVDAFLGGPHRKRLDLAWGVRARVRRPSVRALVSLINRSDMLTADELTGLQMPILLYWGQDDEILASPHLDFYRTHLPDHAEVLTPERMGHAPFLESVQDFLAPVLDFCGRLPAPGQAQSTSSSQK
jgi:pimeloyl-ACP methyl ester carboxylesterase